MFKLVEKYLLKNGERVIETNKLVPGEMYAIGWGKEGYRGFVMPGEEEVSRNNGDISLKNIRICQVASRLDKIETIVGDINLDFIALDLMGTVRLYEESRIRRSIEGALREPESVSAA